MGQTIPVPEWTADNVLTWLLAVGMREASRAEARAGRDLGKKHATGVAPKRRPRYTR